MTVPADAPATVFSRYGGEKEPAQAGPFGYMTAHDRANDVRA